MAKLTRSKKTAVKKEVRIELSMTEIDRINDGEGVVKTGSDGKAYRLQMKGR